MSRTIVDRWGITVKERLEAVLHFLQDKSHDALTKYFKVYGFYSIPVALLDVSYHTSVQRCLSECYQSTDTRWFHTGYVEGS